MPSILSVCDDASLNATRKHLLETCGARVTTADSSAAPMLLANQCFDIILLCHTVEEPEMHRLVEVARRCSPYAAVLLFDAPTSHSAPFMEGAVHHLGSCTSPDVLVARVRQILQATARKEVQSVSVERQTARGSA
jgi:DNA-binding response OmpR family regulator